MKIDFFVWWDRVGVTSSQRLILMPSKKVNRVEILFCLLSAWCWALKGAAESWDSEGVVWLELKSLIWPHFPVMSRSRRYRGRTLERDIANAQYSNFLHSKQSPLLFNDWRSEKKTVKNRSKFNSKLIFGILWNLGRKYESAYGLWKITKNLESQNFDATLFMKN